MIMMMIITGLYVFLNVLHYGVDTTMHYDSHCRQLSRVIKGVVVNLPGYRMNDVKSYFISPQPHTSSQLMHQTSHCGDVHEKKCEAYCVSDSFLWNKCTSEMVALNERQHDKKGIQV